MKKMLKYLHDNGLYETTKRISRRVLGAVGLTKSESYILNLKVKDFVNNDNDYFACEIMKLQECQVHQFNIMKYYDFIDGKELTKLDNSMAFIALDGNQIIGYVCCHFNTKHLIYNMGTWNLDEHEAWLGPTYVVKAYRNKKVHRLLVTKAIEELSKRGVKSFYTAINVSNIPSIKSFSKVGFSKIGIVKLRKICNKTIGSEIENYKSNYEIMGKLELF